MVSFTKKELFNKITIHLNNHLEYRTDKAYIIYCGIEVPDNECCWSSFFDWLIRGCPFDYLLEVVPDDCSFDLSHTVMSGDYSFVFFK